MAQAEKDGDAYNAAVAAQLKARREYLGMTYPAMIERTGLTKQLLTAIMLNQRAMKVADFYNVAGALGLDVQAIAAEADRRVRENLPNG